MLAALPKNVVIFLNKKNKKKKETAKIHKWDKLSWSLLYIVETWLSNGTIYKSRGQLFEISGWLIQQKTEFFSSETFLTIYICGKFEKYIIF